MNKLPRNITQLAHWSALGWVGREAQCKRTPSLLITFQYAVRKTAYVAGFKNGYRAALARQAERLNAIADQPGLTVEVLRAALLDVSQYQADRIAELKAELAAYQELTELPEEPKPFSATDMVDDNFQHPLVVFKSDYDSLRAAYAGLKMENVWLTEARDKAQHRATSAESTVAELRAKLVEAETSLRWAKHPGQGGL